MANNPILIDSDGVTGAYASVTEWLAAETVNNLPVADTNHVVTLQQSTGVPFTDTPDVNQFTTDATRKVDFVVSGTVEFDVPLDAPYFMRFWDDYVNIDGVSGNLVFNENAASTVNCFGIYGRSASNKAKNFHVNGNGAPVAGFVMTGANSEVSYATLLDCMLEFHGGGRMQGATSSVDHITTARCATGLRAIADTLVTNCALVDSVTHADFYDGNRSASSSNNATSDATGDDVGTSNYINLVAANEFADPANDDFTLKPTSSLIGAGTGGSDIGAVAFTGEVTTVTSGILQADDAAVSGSLSIIPNTNLTVGGSIQAQDATVSGSTNIDPVSEVVTATITTEAGIAGSIQAQDAVVSGSLVVTASTADATVAGSVQAQDSSVDGSVLVVPPLTAVLGGGVQAQDATVSGSLLAFIPYRFKYTTAAKLFSAFGKTEMALIASPEQSTVSGDLFYAVMMNKNLSTWSLQQIADANDAASRLADTIQSAEHLIDSYISPRYSLPLSQALIDTSPLPTYCNHIVRFMLMDDRTTEEVDKRYDQAMKWLRDVSMNKASLGADDTAVASSAGRMVSRRGRSKLNWDGF